MSRIGVGAVGELYKAMDESRGTFVALRTLRDVSRAASDSLQQDFLALKAVRDPSLVALGDLDRVDGLWFYTMEFVEGVELLDYVRPRTGSGSRLGTEGGGELSELRLRSALAQLVRAVHALHRAGRVHGNIEPEHVRVTPQGRLVLLECELSGSRDGRATEQRLLSALPFMAPERLEDAPPTPASDWYSVGAVLYQALTNTSPFAASGADLLDQKQKRAPELRPTPHRDLAELCRELLAIDPDARPDYDEIRERLGITSDSEVRPSHNWSLISEAAPFIGRKRELGLLAEAFERTRHGAVSTLCLFGEAGLGKRTLASQLARKLRNEYPHLVHLTGRCEPEGPRAFRGVTGAVGSLTRYLTQQDTSSVATLLPPHADLLQSLFPPLRKLPIPETREPAPREPRSLRRVALRALRTLLSDLSKRAPMLVTLDDMQWADADALHVLDELLRSPEPPNMLLLLLVHGELRAAEPPFRQWLARHDDSVTLMRLKPLGENSSRELADNLLEAGGVADPGVAAARIASQGAGHPLRTDSLARHYLLTGAANAGELTIDDLHWSRMTQLPPEARKLLITLCYARVALPPEVAARAVGCSVEQVTRQIAILRVANLGRTLRDYDGDRYAPSHASVRHAVRARANVDRKRIHHQIAMAMADWREAPADVLATHLRDGGYEERASKATARAADEARDALAFEAAVQLYHEALSYAQGDADEERRLRTELARAYASAGQSERAARAYFEAARHAEPSEALELERQAAHQLLRTGLISDGLATLESVLERLGMRLPRSHTAAWLSLMRQRLLLAVRSESFTARDEESIPLSDQRRVDVLGSLAAALSIIDSVRGSEAQSRYLLHTLKLGDPVRVARALARETALFAVTREPTSDGWHKLLERASTLALQTGDPEARGSVLGARAMASYMRGALRDCTREAAEAERILQTQCTHADWEVSNLRVLRCLAGFLLGELKVHADLAQSVLREMEEQGERHAHANLLAAIGYHPLLMADEPIEAMSMLERVFASMEHGHFHLQQMYQLTGVVQVELYRREGTPYSRLMAAWPLLSKALLLRLPGLAYALRHLRARAGIAQARVDRDERELLLRDAADSGAQLAALRLPYAAGWGHAARAGVDASRGDRERAIQRLEQAEAAFYEGEMTLYAAAARYQLGRLLGNARGRELRAHAEEWFEAQGVRKPENYIAMLLPGFD